MLLLTVVLLFHICHANVHLRRGEGGGGVGGEERGNHPDLRSDNKNVDAAERQLTRKEEGSTTIDFETYENGSPTQKGDVVDDSQTFPGSVIIKAQRSGNLKSDAFGDGKIFDTANVTTGEEDDLAQFSWTGKVLVISANNGSQSPDDAEVGGVFQVEFLRYPVKLNFVRFIDNEQLGSSVTMFDEFGNKIRSVNVPTMTKGGQKLVRYANAIGIRYLRIRLAGPGAIDDLNFFEFYSVPPTMAPTTTLQPTRGLRLSATLVRRVDFGRESLIYSTDLHPDGTQLAVGMRVPVEPRGSDDEIHIFDFARFLTNDNDKTDPPPPLFQIQKPESPFFSIQAISYSPDGSKLASYDSPDEVHVWLSESNYTQSHRFFRGRGLGFHGKCLSWAPDSLHMAAIQSNFGNPNRNAMIWDTTSDDVFLEMAQVFPMVEPNPNRSISALQVSPDGRFLATGETYSALLYRQRHDVFHVHLYDMETGRRSTTLQPPHSRAVTGIKYSPDGTKLATYSRQFGQEGQLYIWNVATNDLLWTFQADGGQVFREKLAWSPNSRFVSLSVFGNVCYVFDAVEGGAPVLILEQVETCLHWSPDGQYLIGEQARRSLLVFRIDEL